MVPSSKSGKKKPSVAAEKVKLPPKTRRAAMSLEALGAAIRARTEELESGLKPRNQFAGELK